MAAPEANRRLARAARCFGANGRLQRWPSKRAEQELVLWVIWSQLPGHGQLSGQEINAMLRTWHDFDDFALLRRELCDMDLMRRTPDGSIYRRVTHTMPADAQALLNRVDRAAP